MLRLLRIIGIVVFALLIGFSSNSLQQMHESGELFETYNSRRRADITLIGFSGFAVMILSYFELSRARRLSRRKSYGGKHYCEDVEPEVDGLDSTNIYASPQSVDEWKGRRTRSSKSYKNISVKAGDGVWMGLLKLICIVLPFLYGGLLTIHLVDQHADPLVAILLPSVFSCLLVISIIAAFGILRKKAWGMTMGYILAICNLLIFPYGTAAGMLLMMGLVGASQNFTVSDKRRSRSKARARRAAAV